MRYTFDVVSLPMPDISGQIDIPKRALFKAAEVCDLVKVQPYVLRSWESEFPELGVSKVSGGPRVYRREDVEQVLRIKHLLLVDGLTLAGARRRLEEESMPVGGVDAPVIDELIGQNARERLSEVKRGLRSLMELLSGPATATDFRLSPPAEGAPAGRIHPARTKPGAAKALARSRPKRST